MTQNFGCEKEMTVKWNDYLPKEVSLILNLMTLGVVRKTEIFFNVYCDFTFLRITSVIK